MTLNWWLSLFTNSLTRMYIVSKCLDTLMTTCYHLIWICISELVNHVRFVIVFDTLCSINVALIGKISSFIYDIQRITYVHMLKHYKVFSCGNENCLIRSYLRKLGVVTECTILEKECIKSINDFVKYWLNTNSFEHLKR